MEKNKKEYVYIYIYIHTDTNTYVHIYVILFVGINAQNKWWVQDFKILISTTIHFSLVQSFSHVRLFATPWTAVHQASLSITYSGSPTKPVSIKSMVSSNHLILCCTLLLLPSIFPSIRVFSNESVLCIKWPKYWSFSLSISPSNNIQDWFPLGWTGWISLQSKGLSRVFSNTTVQKHQFLGA